MNKLNLFVCENFYPEYRGIIQTEEFADVNLIAFPSLCEHKELKAEAMALLVKEGRDCQDGIVICSKLCDMNSAIPKEAPLRVHATGNCFSHIAPEQFMEYIIAKGGYVVSSGWLANWEKQIKNQGFDEESARSFYGEFCKELVYFDTGVDSAAQEKLDSLATFLKLPFINIPIEQESLAIFVRSIVYQWRLQITKASHNKDLAKAQSLSAEYSTILDIISKISSYTNKRDTIKRIEDIFIQVLGAQDFHYWNWKPEKDMPPQFVMDEFLDQNKSYHLDKESGRFILKLAQKEKIFGVIEVGAFLFPQYLERYLNLAIEICNIGALVLSNIEQYMKLAESEKQLQFMSFHDSLTGLYNRTYINEMLTLRNQVADIVVFMFDIDKLKFVNDTFGHLEGNRLIFEVAGIMKACFREKDTVARIGGDEFLAFLPNCDSTLAETIANRISESIKEFNRQHRENTWEMSVSIGFAASEDNHDSLEMLMQKADERMYAQKRAKYSNHSL